MNGSISDVGGILVATGLGVALILLPGYALGSLTGVLGFRALPRGRSLLCAAFLGISLLPAIDSLVVQAANVQAALLANAGLGLAALAPMARSRGDLRDWAAATPILLWLGLVVYALIDVDTGSGLYQSVVVIDLVKHAALTRSIAENGLPLVDPFFARPEPAGYYYYFYTLCAVIDRAGGTLVDGRSAFAGLAFWTGIGLAGLLDRLLAATGLVRTSAPATPALGNPDASAGRWPRHPAGRRQPHRHRLLAADPGMAERASPQPAEFPRLGPAPRRGHAGGLARPPDIGRGRGWRPLGSAGAGGYHRGVGNGLRGLRGPIDLGLPGRDRRGRDMARAARR